MSYQNIKSDLLVELSTEEQQLLSGGKGRRRAIICYEWKKYRDHDQNSRKSDDGDDDRDDDGDD
jgi:hypothetical protein